jgi:predicted enzyme related to lactoylglutathione lyase
LARSSRESHGGDPTQDARFFEVNDVEAAQSEIKDATGTPCVMERQKINGKSYRAFFVVAPDGLCYMVAQRAD